MDTPLGVWGFSKMSDEGLHFKSSHSHKIRPKLREHKSHTNCTDVSFYIKIQHEIHGVRHPIYRNGCLGKQDEQG